MNKDSFRSLSHVLKITLETKIIFLLLVLVVGISTVNCVWAYDSVPPWTRKLSDWWSQGSISDVESVNAFRYLFDNKIIDIPGLNFNHDVSFDKQVQQTRMLSSFLWNSSDKPTDFEFNKAVIPNSKTRFLYVQSPPTWAPYTNNLVLSATNYWEDISGTKFLYSSEPSKASITIRWLKEPDSQYAGYAVGGATEVALGDSRCNGIWHPYDADFVTATLTHELGHALGFGHSENMGDIMYPIVSGEKYAPITQNFVLGQGSSVFVPVCTFSHTSTFHYVVKSDDMKNTLNVFFVPSKMEYDKFVNGKNFSHYEYDGCFGDASVSYDNKCENVSNEGGLIISVPNNFQSQQNVTLTMDEE
jgi:hypothetical protein